MRDMNIVSCFLQTGYKHGHVFTGYINAVLNSNMMTCVWAMSWPVVYSSLDIDINILNYIKV